MLQVVYSWLLFLCVRSCARIESVRSVAEQLLGWQESNANGRVLLSGALPFQKQGPSLLLTV
jgi:hypothetical protein